MIKDYSFELNTENKNDEEKITEKIVGELKAIGIRANQYYFGVEIQNADYTSLVILNERRIMSKNIYIIPKIRVYNISEKNEDDKHLGCIYLNDKMYLKIYGDKNLKVLITLRCEVN